MTADDLAAHARALLDTNRFLTLGTVDPDGRPWTSPVYFATSGLREFYRSSEADAVHSRNLTERPHVSTWWCSTRASGPTTAVLCTRSRPLAN
jgi:predicted pyridoxine 5'-phosphate oxidase superfamily flavin-nucleotide-binding protein